jgi:hypothetical protein
MTRGNIKKNTRGQGESSLPKRNKDGAFQKSPRNCNFPGLFEENQWEIPEKSTSTL